MLTIPKTVTRNDFSHLSKDDLKLVCTDLDLPADGTIVDLASRVWEKIKNSEQLKEEALSKYANKLYCGKSAVTWYALDSGADLHNSKSAIIEALKENPFDKFFVPPLEQITTDPTIIGGVASGSDATYYLRFIYKTGMVPYYYGTEVKFIPTSITVTVYVDPDKNCIEVRTNSKKSYAIAQKFASLIGKSKMLTVKKIMSKYGNNLEEIANNINGQFIDSTSKPELLLENFNADQAQAVLKMLKALDSFFEDDDIENLKQELDVSRNELGEKAANIPFTALVLSGLEKIGLGVASKDLRDNQLYQYLNEYLQHQGGFIKFDCPYEELRKEYTIRVGVGTDSITFLTPATEDAIRYIRDKVILD